MSIQSSLYAFLSADAGVSALVSNRIFPLVVPGQDFDEVTKRPCLVYAQQGVDRSKTFCETIDLQQATFSIDCYAKTYAAAVSLSAAVETALLDYKGPMGDQEIADVALQNKFDLMDLEPGLFRVALSFVIWHAG